MSRAFVRLAENCQIVSRVFRKNFFSSSLRWLTLRRCRRQRSQLDAFSASSLPLTLLSSPGVFPQSFPVALELSSGGRGCLPSCLFFLPFSRGQTSSRPITLRFSDVVLAEEERMIHHEGHEDHEGERNDKTRPSSIPVSCVSHALLRALRALRALRGRNSYLS